MAKSPKSPKHKLQSVVEFARQSSLNQACAPFGKPGGGLLMLMVFLIVFMVVDRLGLAAWAEHAVFAILSVLLVELNDPVVATHGTRIAGLATLIAIGMTGVLTHIRSAEQMVLSTLAILLVVVTRSLHGGGGPT